MKTFCFWLIFLFSSKVSINTKAMFRTILFAALWWTLIYQRNDNQWYTLFYFQLDTFSIFLKSRNEKKLLGARSGLRFFKHCFPCTSCVNWSKNFFLKCLSPYVFHNNCFSLWNLLWYNQLDRRSKISPSKLSCDALTFLGDLLLFSILQSTVFRILDNDDRFYPHILHWICMTIWLFMVERY